MIGIIAVKTTFVLEYSHQYSQKMSKQRHSAGLESTIQTLNEFLQFQFQLYYFNILVESLPLRNYLLTDKLNDLGNATKTIDLK